MTDFSPKDRRLRQPHPLASEFAQCFQTSPGAAVIEFGTGSGRNTRALLAAGLRVFEIGDSDATDHDALARLLRALPPCDGALSTHALLHGTPASIATSIGALGAVLKPSAPFYATLGSVRDARYGKGRRIAAGSYAPAAGDECGVAHAYFDEAGARALLSAFQIEYLCETDVDAVVGSWAHAVEPHGFVHWFLRALRAA